jgi:hypothetical protein
VSLPHAGKYHFLGRRDTLREAQIARDRAILHFRLRQPLKHPKESRRLGPASPERLRFIAHAQLKRGSATSCYWGVSRGTGGDTWLVRFHHRGEELHASGFESADEAAIAVDRLRLHLGLPPINFPERRLKPATLAELKQGLLVRRKEQTSSRYVGVHWAGGDHLGRPWLVFIKFEGCHTCAGSFETERDAALAHDRLVLQYGVRCALNFPTDARRLGPATVKTIRREVMIERKKRTTSRYRGVHLGRSGRWVAQIMHERKLYYLGVYEREEAAATAYDVWAVTLKGEKAQLNFP